MILDDDKIVENNVCETLYVPVKPIREDGQYEPTNDNVKQLTYMSVYQWVSEVPFKVFYNEFIRIIELQKEYKDSNVEYIPAIRFGDCILNFVFYKDDFTWKDGNIHYSNISMDMVACEWNLRDHWYRSTLQREQQRLYTNISDIDELAKHSLEADKKDILQSFYVFMKLHGHELKIFKEIPKS